MITITGESTLSTPIILYKLYETLSYYIYLIYIYNIYIYHHVFLHNIKHTYQKFFILLISHSSFKNTSLPTRTPIFRGPGRTIENSCHVSKRVFFLHELYMTFVPKETTFPTLEASFLPESNSAFTPETWRLEDANMFPIFKGLLLLVLGSVWVAGVCLCLLHWSRCGATGRCQWLLQLTAAWRLDVFADSGGQRCGQTIAGWVVSNIFVRSSLFGEDPPFGLIFFKWVETTNQIRLRFLGYKPKNVPIPATSKGCQLKSIKPEGDGELTFF